VKSKPSNSTQERLNRQFNRIESASGHYYLRDFGSEGIGGQAYTGFIKCKLGHGSGRSLLCPMLSSWEKRAQSGFSRLPLVHQSYQSSQSIELNVGCRLMCLVLNGSKLSSGIRILFKPSRMGLSYIAVQFMGRHL
jgi:hypothetical protein